MKKFLLSITMILSLALGANEVYIESIVVDGASKFQGYPIETTSIHNQGHFAHYYTFVLEETKDIVINSYAMDLNGIFDENGEFLREEPITHRRYVYLINASDVNNSVIASTIGLPSAVNPDELIIKKLNPGTYIIEVSGAEDLGDQVFGDISVSTYIEPERWYKLEIGGEAFFDITTETFSIHREGAYAKYFTLLVDESSYVHFSYSALNPDIVNPHFFLIKGDNENGEVLLKDSFYTTLEPGKYTLEFTNDEIDTSDTGSDEPSHNFLFIEKSILPLVPILSILLD